MSVPGAGAGADVRWRGALDGLAGHLDAAARFVDGLTDEPPAPWSPPPLPPLPAALAGRAAELLGALRVVEQAAQVRRERLADELARPARRRAPAASPAVLVDRLI